MKNIFSIKEILNENIHEHQLTDKELQQLQNCLLYCYSELIDVCNKYGIKPFLQGGTLLGKVRHNGFIPWDDDLDLGMSREDYNTFISIFDRELGARYEMSAPQGQHPAYNRFVQIFRKETVLRDVFSQDSRMPECICIDIFPIDYAPNNPIIRKLKGYFCNMMMLIAGCVDTYNDKSVTLKEIMCSSMNGRILYEMRKVIGFLFSWKSFKKWVALVDTVITENNVTRYATSATGRKHYLGEIVPADTFFPLKKTTFCGLSVYMPNQPEVYLKNLYGDYMRIPPEEERERHHIIELKVLEENN